MDLVVRTQRFPDPGETVAGYEFNTFPGGKGANQAVAAARQGAEVSMIGRVGDDRFGLQLLETLRGEGIDVAGVTVDEQAPTGVAMIAIDEAGNNVIIVAPEANGNLSVRDVESRRSLVAGADMLIVQLEVRLEVVEYAVRLAKEEGVEVVLNPAPAQPMPTSLLRHIDYLIPNESEALLLSQSKAPREAASILRSKGARVIIITMGEHGALLMENEETISIPGFEVSVSDVTAAGDAFVGAFATRVAAGLSTAQAVRWANASGALAATVLGAQVSLPTFDTVSEFLGERGVWSSSRCRSVDQ
jgi:ribokinase